ncbi:MAG: GNAT family N-acetyltransferase [Anaerolineaceae bacterium]|nr:GNAT family N-acetyltransferase [Anaerolineaceae bacterium]
MNFSIQAIESEKDKTLSAEMMQSTSPWSVFGRSFEECLSAFNTEGKFAFGAYSIKDLLGFVVVDITGPLPCYIQALCIAQKHRGQGIGSALMDYAEQFIFLRSPNAFLCYSDFNPSVRIMYERRGYSLIGTLHNYMIPGHDEYLMRKSISAVMPFRRYSL